MRFFLFILEAKQLLDRSDLRANALALFPLEHIIDTRERHSDSLNEGELHDRVCAGHGFRDSQGQRGREADEYKHSLEPNACA